MEAAFTKFRTVIAIVATIVMGAAMVQTIAPAAGEPARMPAACPPNVLENDVDGGAAAAAPRRRSARSSAKRDRPFAAGRRHPCDRAMQARPCRLRLPEPCFPTRSSTSARSNRASPCMSSPSVARRVRRPHGRGALPSWMAIAASARAATRRHQISVSDVSSDHDPRARSARSAAVRDRLGRELPRQGERESTPARAVAPAVRAYASANLEDTLSSSQSRKCLDGPGPVGPTVPQARRPRQAPRAPGAHRSKRAEPLRDRRRAPGGTRDGPEVSRSPRPVRSRAMLSSHTSRVLELVVPLSADVDRGDVRVSRDAQRPLGSFARARDAA